MLTSDGFADGLWPDFRPTLSTGAGVRPGGSSTWEPWLQVQYILVTVQGYAINQMNKISIKSNVYIYICVCVSVCVSVCVFN
jgi:hypothetical protein